jgi:hypothetical protein
MSRNPGLIPRRGAGDLLPGTGAATPDVHPPSFINSTFNPHNFQGSTGPAADKQNKPHHVNMSTFNIIICGAGLGGLGAAIALRRKGHQVTVLEGAQQLAEVGAGIQIPPNSSRVLSSYGLYDELTKVVVWPQNICFKRYANGVTIGKTPLHPTMKEKYGYP